MEQKIKTYFSEQPADRREILAQLHKTIEANDPSVSSAVGLMMGKEMVIYNAKGMMKYALASGKKHMSLHVLPMYMNTSIYEKYKALLPEAAFQKGCINFEEADVIPLNVVKKLITDCSTIDLVAIREKYLADKKAKAKKVKTAK